MAHTIENTVVSSDMDIDAALAGLDFDIGELTEISPERLIEAADDILEGEILADPFDETIPDAFEAIEAVAQELGREELKAEIYAAETAGSDLITERPVLEELPAIAIEVKAEKPASTGTARPRGDVNGLAAEMFVLTADDADRDLAENKATVLALRPSAKKIAEKFDNLFLAVAAGKKPSAYTMLAFGVLDEKGEMTSGELVKAMQDAGYTIGTSRSQSQQMMALLPVLKVATKRDGKLVLNPDSTLAGALRALSAAPIEIEPTAEV